MATVLSLETRLAQRCRPLRPHSFDFPGFLSYPMVLDLSLQAICAPCEPGDA